MYIINIYNLCVIQFILFQTFSSLQIGELLSIHSDDQKRLLEKKTQQKSKREMTFNELEMFLNNDEETNKKIDEFSQKIDSEQDTVYYYESSK